MSDKVKMELERWELERLVVASKAVGQIPSKSLNMGVIREMVELAAAIIESKDELPDDILKRAAVIDTIIGLGMREQENKNAEAPEGTKAQPEDGAQEPSPAPAPSTSL